MSRIQTYSGRMVDPLNLASGDILLADIAHALANLCRFTGHTSRFYSVAEHSVHVSRLVPEPFMAWALLHDASEAYLQDMPSPLKILPEFTFYREAERALQEQVALRFRIPVSHLGSERAADEAMLHREGDELMEADWTDPELVGRTYATLPYPNTMFGMPPDLAEEMFLLRARQLGLR